MRLVIVLILSALAAGCVTTRTPHVCLTALQAQKFGQYDTALLHYESCLADSSLSPRARAAAHLARGSVQAKKQNYDAAIADLNIAAKSPALSRKSQASAHIALGSIYRSKAQYDDAFANLNKAVEITPDNYLAYQARGRAYRQSGQFDEAIQDFTKAIEIEPEKSGLYNLRALTYNQRGDLVAGTRDFEKAIETDTKPGWIYYNRSLQHTKSKNFAAALEDQEKMQRLAPGDWKIHVARGQTFMWMGQYEKSIHELNKIPEPLFDFFALDDRGLIFFLQNHLEDAVRDLTRASTKKKDRDPKIARWLFLAKLKSGKDGTSDLRKSLAETSGTEWQKDILRFLLGDKSEEDLFAATKIKYKSTESLRMCQANYVAGTIQYIKGNRARALTLLRASANATPPVCFESIAAEAEIKRITQIAPGI